MPKFTSENAAENGRKGGIAKGVNAAKRRSMREQADILLGLEPGTSEKLKMKKMGIPDEIINNEMSMLVAIFKKALTGNVKAAELIVEIMGEKADINVNVNKSEKLDDIISQIGGSGLKDGD